MTSKWSVRIFTFKKRILGLWLAMIIILSSLINMSWNVEADPDNVWVEGYVYKDATIIPIQDAIVILSRGETVNITTTDATGYFNLSIYYPSVDLPTFFDILVFHDDYQKNEFGVFLFEGYNDIGNIYLKPVVNKNSYVHGEVYDAVTWTPIPSQGVSAYGVSYINLTTTNTTGYYWMALESDQQYNVQVDRPGFETQTRRAVFRDGDNLSFYFYLEPMNCTLKGYVRNASGPVGSAQVKVYRFASPNPIIYWPEVDSITGYYELLLTRGVWQVEVTEANHSRQTLTVLMFNGQKTWQDFILNEIPKATATVQGQIRYYHDGSVVPDADVSIRALNNSWEVFDNANSTGWYNLSVPVGDIIISAWKFSYRSTEIVLNVTEGSINVVDLIIFEWTEKAFLDGYVRYGGIGEPEVRVIVDLGQRWYEDITNESGYYNITLPGAPLDVQAVKEGFYTVYQHVNTTLLQTERLDMNLIPLDWSSEVRGYIENTTGDPMEGAYISFDYDGHGYMSSFAAIDYTGLYQVMVPSGNSTYYIIPEDHEVTSGEISLPPDQLSWHSDTLIPIDMEAKIICKLTNIYTNEPIRHTKLTFSEQELYWTENVETDGDGMVRASVPSGFFRINIDSWTNGYEDVGMYEDMGRMQFLLRPGETRWLNISLFPRDITSLIHGYVNDTGNIPIPGARVYVRYGDKVQSVLTNSTGYYQIFLPGDHWITLWIRAPGYRRYEEWIWINQGTINIYDWQLQDSPAWMVGPITDSVVDFDSDTFFNVLYVNLTVDITTPDRYRLNGDLREARSIYTTLSRAETRIEGVTGPQFISLEFRGEQIRASGKNGYYVELRLEIEEVNERLDTIGYFTDKHTWDEFDEPDVKIEKPIEHWLLDSDFDGLYNYLIFNITINVSVEGEYALIGVLNDIWGSKFSEGYLSLSLEPDLHEVQISFDGPIIYNHGENLGNCNLLLFEGTPQESSEYIDELFFYAPYENELFQSYPTDTTVFGTITDSKDQPIENMWVYIYNTTYKFMNQTLTDVSGYYELGGWGGEWIVVVDDDDDQRKYQGNLSEIILVSGVDYNHDVRYIPYTGLDRITETLTFSDWDNAYYDWLQIVEGDNETIRFFFDTMEWGNGDGFISEEESNVILEMLSSMSLPDNSTDFFLVDGIWYDINQSTKTVDVGLVGPVTSNDPIYIHLTGEYIANSSISNPSPHYLNWSCYYDDTRPPSITDENASYIYYLAPPSTWGRSAHQPTPNVIITGSDFVTADPLSDPNPMDEFFMEWINLTISSGAPPTTCTIKGNVTLIGSVDHSGVVVTIIDNATQLEITSAPTNPNGYYQVLGLSDGTYDIVAYKPGYGENRSDAHVIALGETIWIDFTLYSYPPTISHSPITSAMINTPITIYADVSDDGAVDTVQLHYMEVGSGSYVQTDMARIASTSTYQGSIPAQSQAGLLYYYIWANDTKGNSVTHPELGNHTVTIYELDPPIISNVDISPSIAEYPEQVNVSAQVIDGYKVENVTLFIEKPGGGTSNTTMDYDPNTGKYYLNTSYDMLGTYNFTIWANDSFNNLNSFNGSFEVSDTISPTSNVETIMPYWFNATPISVNAMASDSGGIGVENVELWFRYAPDNSSWGDWTLFDIDDAALWFWSFDFPDGDGFYEFFSIANDTAGNAEAWKGTAEAICGYDTMTPTSSVDIIVPYWYNSTMLTITASANDGLSQVNNVGLWYRYAPDNTSWGGWTWFDMDTAEPWSFLFSFSDGEGYYEFFSNATDNVSNAEAFKGSAEAICAYDISAPTSSVDIIGPYWYNTTSVMITVSASDGLSNVESVELWYRNSTNNSSWGQWTPFDLDISEPWSLTFDFPENEGFYEFFSIANDSAGNSEAMKATAEAICGYDTLGPASFADVLTFYWFNTTFITINATASDLMGEVGNVTLWYRYAIDNSTWNEWISFDVDISEPWSFTFDFPGGDGFYEFFSIANDSAGNSETIKVAAETICGYDPIEPTSYVDALSSYWYNITTITITVTASDATSDVNNVGLWYRYAPDNSSWGGWTWFDMVTSQPWSFFFSFSESEGYYEFFSNSTDKAGNTEAFKGSAETICAYDISAPTSSVDVITPYWQDTTPLKINVSAYDGFSDVKSVELWYNYSTDNSSWGGWMIFATDTVEPWSWDFDFPDGEGYYEFFSIANDTVGNSELMKTTNETICGYDAFGPESSVDALALYWYNTSSITVNVTASDLTGFVGNVTLWYIFAVDNSSWGQWTPFDLDISEPWSFTFDFPEGEGYYGFHSIANDTVGNSEPMKTTNETICGFDMTDPTSYVDILTSYWYITSPIQITVTPSDLISNVTCVELYYRYANDNTSWGNWTPLGIVNTEPWFWDFDFPDGDGFYEFFSLANDTAGNSEGMKVSAEIICGYDTAVPDSDVDEISTYWQTSSPTTINATAYYDTSDVVSMWLRYRYSTDNSNWGDWEWFDVDMTFPWSWDFDFPYGDGYYRFHSLANDTAGNDEAMKASVEANCGFDTTAPTSNLDPITPYWWTTSPITITALASDATSDVASVELFYRYSDDNSSWSSPTSFGTDNVPPSWSWSFDFPDGEGFYQFYSIATDFSGLEETAPASADAICALDTSGPSITSFSAIPDPCELGQTINISATISDISGIDETWIDISFDGNQVGNYSTMSNFGKDYWFLLTPDGSGGWNIALYILDNNGLWSSSSTSISVQDTVPPSVTDFKILPPNPQVETIVKVSVNVSDIADITVCRINITNPSGDWLLNESMTNDEGTDEFYYEMEYDSLGEYQILIWAVDDNGLGFLFTDIITIRDTPPPHADAGPIQDITAGTQVNLDAGQSTDNYGIANYTWSFNDNGLKRLYGESVYYTFNTPGNYQITLMVKDFGGNTGTAATWVNVSAVTGTGTVTGTVRDEDGNPVEGAIVYVEGYPSVEDTTDSYGRFQLDNVPIGTQTIIIEKDGYKWYSQDADVQQDQTESFGNIALPKSAVEDETPWALIGALIAVIAAAAVLLFFFLMKRRQKAKAAETVIDEVFFMYNDGRLVRHFTRRLKPDMDEDILSSMLVAVQDFIKDSFKDQEGILDELKFGKFQVLLGRGEHIILATIVLGEELEPFRPQIQKCVKDIEEKYAEILEDWDGDVSALSGASKHITDLFEGKYA